MKCALCGKEKKKWFICSACFELLRTKYPNYSDLVKVIREHKKECIRGDEK